MGCDVAIPNLGDALVSSFEMPQLTQNPNSKQALQVIFLEQTESSIENSLKR